MKIKIFTTTYGIEAESIIVDNDAYFDENVTAKSFGVIGDKAIKIIDNAYILDRNTGTIKTPRGICALEDLSTGCKTVLNYLYIIKNDDRIKAIDASGCGANALDVLFSTIEEMQYPIDIVIMHRDELYKCKEREYVINNSREIKNLLYM